MATPDDDLRSALSLIESERVKLLGCERLGVDEIISMGGVEYVMKYVPDDMKKQAHHLAMPKKDHKATVTAHPESQDEQTPLDKAYKLLWLDFFKVQKYLDEVDLHIQNIQTIGRIIYPNHTALLHRFNVHDCSKFSYKEVYGYVLRWTHGIKDCPEWKVSLDHHLLTNDHHPEFFREEPMHELGLLESVVDMLSWRVVKNRAEFPNQPVQDWLFDVEDRYLVRYVEEDRLKVRQLLTEWKNAGFEVNHL